MRPAHGTAHKMIFFWKLRRSLKTEFIGAHSVCTRVKKCFAGLYKSPCTLLTEPLLVSFECKSLWESNQITRYRWKRTNKQTVGFFFFCCVLVQQTTSAYFQQCTISHHHHRRRRVYICVLHEPFIYLFILPIMFQSNEIHTEFLDKNEREIQSLFIFYMIIISL